MRSRLDGRRLWFVGIGGAGLSAYAQLAAAWGAEVGGWDRVATPYLEPLRDHELVIGEEPVAPPGWEVVVSTAYAGRVEGKPRAELLAELVALRPSIVVAGTHGKTTTSGMIAYVLERLGRDPAFAIGGTIPQLGGNARAGDGWFVVEGDESDRTITHLRPEIAVVLNVELDHHSEFASRAELQSLFDEWTAAAPHVVRGDAVEPLAVELSVPGEHNRRNASVALAALELAGVSREEALPVLQRFTGAGRRFELRGEARGVRVFDDYAHHPAELAATLRVAREVTGRRVLVLFQPHLYTRTLHLAREFADALATADVAAVTDVYPAREQPLRGVTGKLIVDAVEGTRVAWTPEPTDGARWLARLARAGDVVLMVGAGDVDGCAPLVLKELR